MTEDTQHKHEEFLRLAQERYGDKICVRQISISDEEAKNLLMLKKITKEELTAYPKQAWIPVIEGKGYLCPECEEQLGGLFGAAQWALRHGEMFCNGCNKVFFRYYHFFGEDQKRLEMFALSQFPKKDKPKST